MDLDICADEIELGMLSFLLTGLSINDVTAPTGLYNIGIIFKVYMLKQASLDTNSDLSYCMLYSVVG